jgi:hypothetical protein
VRVKRISDVSGAASVHWMVPRSKFATTETPMRRKPINALLALGLSGGAHAGDAESILPITPLSPSWAGEAQRRPLNGAPKRPTPKQNP